MSRISMYVYNDVEHDARVIREARTLVRAGHTVTVIGRPTDATARSGDRLVRDGFEIVRIPVPGAWRTGWTLAVHPWRLCRGLIARIRLGVRRLPREAAGSIGALGLLGLALAWSVVAYPVHRVARALRPPGGHALGPVEWLVRWRFAVNGWAGDAAKAGSPADVHHGHDLTGLAAAVRGTALQRDAVVVYDSHEIYLEARTSAEQPRWARRVVEAEERRWSRRAAAVITVNPSIEAELVSRLQPRRTAVVYNCPPRWTPPDAMAGPGPLRERIGVGQDVPIAIHHGSFARHRGLEQLVRALDEPGLDATHLVFLGYGPLRSTLERLAADHAAGDRIHVIDAVDPDDLPGWLHGADLGVMPIQPSTLNHRLSTPNKLFDCLGAGVPVVVSDFPEMRRIVVDGPDGVLGAVCDPASPASIGQAMRAIIESSAPDRRALRERCLRAAHVRWNWEAQAETLLGVYAGLPPRTDGPGPGTS